MKSVVMPFAKPSGDVRKLQAAHAISLRLVGKPFQQPACAKRDVWFDLVAAVWYGAMAGFIAAAFIPPSMEGRSSNKPE